MPRPHEKHLARLTAILFLSFLFCLQGVVAAGQNKDEPLIEINGLINMLAKGGHSREEIILMVARRGVSSELTEVLEGDLREAGKYLGKDALDELVEAVRANYIRAVIDEPLELRLGDTVVLKRFGFKATYKGMDGYDYLLQIERPGAPNETAQTHAGCEHTYVWGSSKVNRQYKLHIISADRQKVIARLQRNIAPATMPKSTQIYAAPCMPISMQLVIGKNTDSSNPVEPYYISEPLTVGVFRQYALALGRPIRTPIPASAKDSDPIEAIYYEDAHDIATMLSTHLPTLEQLVNALNGRVLNWTSQAELVTDTDQSLLVVRQANGQPTSSTQASAQVTVSKVPIRELARGLVRVVRPARNKIKSMSTGPGMPTTP